MALAQAVDPLPVVLYNVPGRTAVNLEPETVVRLDAAAPNIQAIKEASGKLTQIAQLVHSLPRSFKVFSGDDNLALASIGVGAHGLISVASNEAPAEVSHMVHAALEQRLGGSSRAGAPLEPPFRGQFLGVESRPGENDSRPDGPVYGPRPSAAGTSHRRHSRPARTAGQ
jgi:dihydrodipicolinate synthase/N-acetylneuraminate lyase